jgi:hypothetical protein
VEESRSKVNNNRDRKRGGNDGGSHGENAIQPEIYTSAIASFMLMVQSFFSNGFMLTSVNVLSIETTYKL